MEYGVRPRTLEKHMSTRRPLALHWKILIGFTLGVILGITIDRLWTPATWASLGVNDAQSFMAPKPGEAFASGKGAEANQDAGLVAKSVRFLSNANTFIGQLFFQSLRFIAVPVVFCSLIVGVASLGDIKRLGRIGVKTLGYFAITGAVAITLGLVIANLAEPGKRISAEKRAELLVEYESRVTESVTRTLDVPSMWQQILSMIPANPFQALATAQMLQVIFFSIAIGLGLTMITRSKAEPVLQFFDALTDVIVKLVGIVMHLAPYAVFCLVLQALVNMGTEMLVGLVSYVVTVVFGLGLVLVVVYPLLLRTMAGVGFRRFFRAMSPAMLTAFSSSSSSATLPVTIACASKRLGVSERITSFVCPLGATVNMDGTAMYQGIAAMFIAQMYVGDLSVAQQLTIVLTALLASIGTPGIPGAGVVMLVIVLESVGIPTQGIAIILGVDRLLDMLRTVVNVAGDSTAAAIVAKSEGELESEAEVARRLADDPDIG